MSTVDSVAPAGSFLAGVGASFVLKLTTSVDDLVWFSPFLAMSTSKPQKIKYCSVYAIVCVLVAVAALCLAKAAELGFDAAASAISGENDEEGGGGSGESFWDASTVLSLFASAIIFIYALVELRGWIREGNELPLLREVCTGAGRWCLSLVMSPAYREGRCGGDANDNAVVDGSDGDGSNSPRQYEHDIEFTVLDDTPEKYRNIQAVANANEAVSSEGRTSSKGRGPVSRAANESTAESTAESAMINEEDLEQADGREDDEDEDDEVSATIRTASKSTYALFAVALCGTVDDMILFAAVVAGRGIPWTSVLPGSILAAAVVLVVCWHISLYEPFANFVRSVPMWALLGAISLYLLVGVFV